MRRLLVVPALAAALLSSAPAAKASTFLARPVSTISSNWTTAPPNADLSTVVDDPVAAPSAPTVAGDEAHADGAGVWTAGVRLQAPPLGEGERATSARISVYAEVGAPATLAVTLRSGDTVVGELDLPAGSKPAWYASGPLALDGIDPSALTLTFVTTRQSGPGPTKVAAAYVDVTSGPAETVPSPSAPLGPATLDAPPTAPPAAELVTPATIALPARATAVPFSVGCPAGDPMSCRGTIELQLAGAAPAAKRSRGRAHAARCARGCRVLGKGTFEVAAGAHKTVRVKLNRAARKVLKRGRTVKATVVTTTRSRAGDVVVTRRPVGIRRSG